MLSFVTCVFTFKISSFLFVLTHKTQIYNRFALCVFSKLLWLQFCNVYNITGFTCNVYSKPCLIFRLCMLFTCIFYLIFSGITGFVFAAYKNSYFIVSFAIQLIVGNDMVAFIFQFFIFCLTFIFIIIIFLFVLLSNSKGIIIDEVNVKGVSFKNVTSCIIFLYCVFPLTMFLTKLFLLCSFHHVLLYCIFPLYLL